MYRASDSLGWIGAWRGALLTKHRPSDMPGLCPSCIDRGFQQLVSRMVDFVGAPAMSFEVHHVDAEDPSQVVRW